MAAPLQPSDNELARLALGGSSDAYRRLVRRFERPLLSLIRRMVHDPELAEDLAQEAFVKAFRHLERYDSQRKFSSWLFKIAHNTTLDYLRRRRLDTVPLEISGDDGDGSWEYLPAPESASPDFRAEQKEVAGAIGRALQGLKPAYREILLLRFQQGFAYHEIAEVTGLKMGTVKVHLHRARKLLAAELEKVGVDGLEKWT